MRKVEDLKVGYVGYSNPETQDEVDFEILGLNTAICQISKRIAILRQGIQLNKLQQLSIGDETDAEAVEPVTAEDKQEG